MHALLMALVLFGAEPSPHFVYVAPTPVTGMTIGKMVESPRIQVPPLNRSLMAVPESTASFDLSILTDLVPYSAELNDWYQRYRADKRWENGVGLTFTVSNQRHKWTLGLGPLQFVLAGRYGPLPR